MSHTLTSWILSACAYVVGPDQVHRLWCDACSDDGSEVQLLIGRCATCDGLLVACDNTTCPYVVECVCRLEVRSG